MKQQIFLITPISTEINSLSQYIEEVLSTVNIAALLLLRENITNQEYKNIAQKILDITRANNCALILDNDALLAKKLGVDGVHIDGDLNSIKAALSLLKPDMIVGAGNVKDRHDAMQKGELGVDYILFTQKNATEKNATEKNAKERDVSIELSDWWAEVFEVPAIYNIPKNNNLDRQIPNCEFIALNCSDYANPKQLINRLNELNLIIEPLS